MRKSEYSEKLKHPMWQKRRLEILNRDGFKCRLCGAEESQLHVHHLSYHKGADPWDYRDSLLLTVCEDCHGDLHENKYGDMMLEAVVSGGAKADDILKFCWALSKTFSDGDYPIELRGSGWDKFSDCIESLAFAAYMGVPAEKINAALKELAWEPTE